MWVLAIKLFGWGVSLECGIVKNGGDSDVAARSRPEGELAKHLGKGGVRGSHDSSPDDDSGAGLGGDGGEGSEVGAGGSEDTPRNEASEVYRIADEARKTAHRVEVALSRFKADLTSRPGDEPDTGAGGGRRILSGRRIRSG